MAKLAVILAYSLKWGECGRGWAHASLNLYVFTHFLTLCSTDSDLCAMYLKFTLLLFPLLKLSLLCSLWIVLFWRVMRKKRERAEENEHINFFFLYTLQKLIFIKFHLMYSHTFWLEYLISRLSFLFVFSLVLKYFMRSIFI